VLSSAPHRTRRFTMAGAAFEVSKVRRVGFLADTHSRKADGSDLPQQALDAFAGVDLIVHLGDIGQKGILARLAAVAPVLVPAGDDKGWIPVGRPDVAPLKVLEAAGLCVGLAFNLTKPDKAIVVADAALQFAKPLPDLMKRRFGRSVDVVAFGGTHRQRMEEHEGVVFFDPGSPTLPSDKQGEDDLGSVSVLDLGSGKAKVEQVKLRKA
jgi:putative phosphoesterase